jgi:hypothetical protein
MMRGGLSKSRERRSAMLILRSDAQEFEMLLLNGIENSLILPSPSGALVSFLFYGLHLDFLARDLESR